MIVYFLISNVQLAEKNQELSSGLDNWHENKISIFEGTSQELAVREEISKPASDCGMAYCGILFLKGNLWSMEDEKLKTAQKPENWPMLQIPPR